MENIYNLDGCDREWRGLLNTALETMDRDYLKELVNDKDWLPGPERLFAAFSLPLSKTRYILLGESPYPRAASANGYAFWDNNVESLWSPQGLSKSVNKATSLRNWIKMLLVARGELTTDLSQQAIANLDKSHFVNTAEEFFLGMMKRGILLLNASLVYSKDKVPYHARHWKPFMNCLLNQLALTKPSIQLILFGKIAEAIPRGKLLVGLVSEHPYNVSFILNKQVLDFFKPLDLLSND